MNEQYQGNLKRIRGNICLVVMSSRALKYVKYVLLVFMKELQFTFTWTYMLQAITAEFYLFSCQFKCPLCVLLLIDIFIEQKVLNVKAIEVLVYGAIIELISGRVIP